MVWISDNDKHGAAIQELDSLPDRAAAIVAGALLDERLEFAIRRTLRDAELSKGQTVQSRLFDFSGALGAFGVKIDLGFMINLYGDGARRDMTLIAKIRNRFAHDLEVRTFSSVRDLCANLTNFERHYFEHGHEAPAGATSWLVSEPDLKAHLADSRLRFMMAVRLYFSALFVASSPPGI